MRIIENPNPTEEIEKVCPVCECKFAYTEGDIKTYTYSNGILGPSSYGYIKKYVLCPNCGKEIIIEEQGSTHYDFERLAQEIEEMYPYPHLTENPDDDGE